VLANSAQFAFHAVVMFMLARRVIPTFQTSGLWRTVGRAGAAALAMALSVAVVTAVVGRGIGDTTFLRQAVIVLSGMAVGAVIYLGGAWLFRLDEVRYFGEILRARIRRGG
jgi:putative peptidoglycan lipid II flippase